MYGDYISTTVTPDGPAVTVAALAQPPGHGRLNVAMYGASLPVGAN